MLDRLTELEGEVGVVQFSGGEPTLHPQILPMLQAAKDRHPELVMLNTNGLPHRRRTIAFLTALVDAEPVIYLQFDGLTPRTAPRAAQRDLLAVKLQALERLAQAKLRRRAGGDHREVASTTTRSATSCEFGLEHPAVSGIAFQPVSHAGRFAGLRSDGSARRTPTSSTAWPSRRRGSSGEDDFTPVPCCHPTCRSAAYAYVEDGAVTPLRRVLGG